MIRLEFISPFFDGRVETGLETSLFGRIVASEGNDCGEISPLLLGGHRGCPDTGTTIELVTVFANESGRLDYLLEPLDAAAAAGGPLPPIEIEIVRSEAGSSSQRRIFLNGERHEGDIVHLLDLEEENKIRAET